MINKRGVEEVVGFVLIVVLVAVIALVFLGLMIRQGQTDLKKDSREVENFLASTLEYTSQCTTTYEPDYLSIGGLIDKCRQGAICLSGEKACDTLKGQTEELLEAGWLIGEQSFYKGYMFKITTGKNQSMDELVSISKGNCSFNIKGAEYPYPPDAHVELILCN